MVAQERSPEVRMSCARAPARPMPPNKVGCRRADEWSRRINPGTSEIGPGSSQAILRNVAQGRSPALWMRLPSKAGATHAGRLTFHQPSEATVCEVHATLGIRAVGSLAGWRTESHGRMDQPKRSAHAGIEIRLDLSPSRGAGGPRRGGSAKRSGFDEVGLSASVVCHRGIRKAARGGLAPGRGSLSLRC
jgi:hypothetical protein